MGATELAAFLKRRLSNAEDDWRQLLASMYDQVLKTPADHVIDRTRVRAVIEQHLVAHRAEDVIRLAFHVAVRPAVAGGRNDDAAVGRWMPEEAQQRLAALAGEKGFVQKAWVEELFKQDAAEELLSETLYQTLKDFSVLVPRILQKVLPSGLGRLAGFAASAGTKMFDEVERMLDGEIRRFLDAGTRKALERAAGFTAQTLDAPTGVQGRQNMVRFALSKSGQFHVDPMTDARIDELQAIIALTAAHLAEHDEFRAVVDHALDRAWADMQGQTFGELLSAAGVTATPPFDEWALATWPIVRTAFEAPEVQAWIDRLSEEFFAQG